MSSSFKSWSITALTLCALALAAFTSAQTQNYPTFKGSNLRPGNNGLPATDNAGATNLVWYQPGPAATPYSSMTEDNQSTLALFLGNWLAPNLNGSATGAFTYGSVATQADATIGLNYLIPYLYSPVIPSNSNGNPLQAQNGYLLSQFIWTLGGAANLAASPTNNLGNIPGDFALSVNIPAGPNVDINGNYTYQPEFYVFQVNYGTGATFVDVVDTAVSGTGGWVRLGNGGYPSSVLFHYDGVTPITITLFNTVPRDPSTGLLEGVLADAAGNLLNAYAVDANAVEATPNFGSYYSSPIIGTDQLGNTAVFAAVNQNVVTQQNGTTTFQQKGVLSSYAYNWAQPTGPPNYGITPPGVNWTYSPTDQGSIGITQAIGSAGVSATANWINGLAVPLTGFAGYVGSTYLYEAVTQTLANADVATFAPTLAAGTYDVQLWLPGPTNPAVAGYPKFAQNVQVEVDQGATQAFFTVNLTQTNGFVSISPGNRFTNTQAAPLVVKISNYDAAAADAGLLAFANSVRFVGAENLAITSTPAQQINVPISYQYFDPVQNKTVEVTQLKTVVVVCAEDGHIYCLDATGRGDGTTDIYWAYPSLPDPLNTAWTDPNNNSPVGTLPTAPDGAGGVTVAQMPTGFSLSSPLIQLVNGTYYLFVAANNGRVYCINMQGRGDGDITTRTPGTTTRVWTFPNDYRPDNPTIPSAPSALGATNAAVLYNNNPVDGPTLFVPSAQGRMYALNAVGNTAQTTTTTNWIYPPTNALTVGPFNSTPAIDGPAGGQALYVGTEMKPYGGPNVPGLPGQFFSFNIETGAVNWTFSGGDAAGPTSNFEGGPATAFNGLADGVAGSEYVFAPNQNGFVYAFNATNGNVIWEDNELGSSYTAPVMFTYATVYGNNGFATAVPQPVLEVPDSIGHFNMLFASGAGTTFIDTNVDGGKFAGGYSSAGSQIVAGTASGHTYMYGADNLGYLYAFQNGSGFLDSGINGPGNGGDIAPPNSPESQSFNGATVAFITQTDYNYLRFPATEPSAATALAAGNIITRNAFDFGETLYILVYNFPYNYNYNGQGGQGIPSITFTFSTAGRTIRAGTAAVAQQWIQQGAGYTNPTNGQTYPTDGYAVYAFPLNVAGSSALAAGPNTLTTNFSLTTATGGHQYIFGNGIGLAGAGAPGGQTKTFTMANPLGLAMLDIQNGVDIGFGVINDSLGADVNAFGDPTNAQNAVNGTIITTPLFASAGLTTHGTSTPTRTVYAYDRSLMQLLTGPDTITSAGVGSFNIRMDRANAAWNGGYAAVIKPFGGPNGLYQGSVPLLENWEDYPSEFPNISLDYPDILPQYLTTTAYPTTSAGNPLFSGVPLTPPSGVLGVGGVPNATFANRTPNPVPLNINLAVPMFQPANLSFFQDPYSTSNNSTVDGLGRSYDGYTSPMDVFIDSTGNPTLNSNVTANQQVSSRSFTFGAGVDVSEHMSVLTPNVDLGALPDGAGLFPSNGVTIQSVLSPWVDLTSANHIYESFQAVNDGNVNLLNIRIAKSYNYPGGNYYGWPFNDTGNDDLGYLDGSLYLWSDLDAYNNNAPIGFSPSLAANGGPFSRGEIISQKPRTTAISGTQISPNTVNFSNGNLGNPGNTAVNNSGNYPINQPPHVGVTPPIGFPSGSYYDIVRLIEDRSWQQPANYPYDYDLSILLGQAPVAGETYADPTFGLSFTVREARLTNTPTTFDSAMTDNLLTGGATNSFDSNIEPTGMRDRTFGNLFFAWSSNRTALNNGALSNGDFAYRIYGGSLSGSTPATTGSPLNELAKFTGASAQQWFGTAGPYPFGASLANSAVANSAFGGTAPNHVVGTLANEEDTVRFGQPSLPSTGLRNPFVVGDATGATDFAHAIMAFTGSAVVQTSSNRVNANRLFAATVQPTQNASATIGAAIPSPNDLELPKGKPSVAQVGPDTAVIFYGASSGGRTNLYYTLFNDQAGSFSEPVGIDTGPGFDTVGDPSAQARLYQGVDAVDETQLGYMIELSFSARLRGRRNNEIFLARIPTDATGAPNEGNSNKELLSYFAQRTNEQLERQESGVYRAVGVGWNPAGGAVNLLLSTGGAAPVSIITPLSPQVYDPQSGILTLQTSLGVVYADTFQGTVRFANTTPGSQYLVFATYQPKFLRLSVAKDVELTGPVLLWDDRHVGSTDFNQSTFQMFDRFWYVGAAHATLTDPRLLNNRYFAMYNRSATTTGQSARPLMETLRLGVQLPTAIPTLASGDVNFGLFNVVNPNGNNPYQVDPSSGRVYFTALDEDVSVTITVNGVQYQLKVGLLPEQSEAPVLIEQPINEGRVAGFIDPFDSTGVNNRRPDMVWMLWSSTRAGTSDIFFQTIAPLLWPVIGN